MSLLTTNTLRVYDSFQLGNLLTKLIIWLDCLSVDLSTIHCPSWWSFQNKVPSSLFKMTKQAFFTLLQERWSTRKKNVSLLFPSPNEFYRPSIIHVSKANIASINSLAVLNYKATNPCLNFYVKPSHSLFIKSYYMGTYSWANMERS